MLQNLCQNCVNVIEQYILVGHMFHIKTTCMYGRQGFPYAKKCDVHEKQGDDGDDYE